jgi:hypothetical protein
MTAARVSLIKAKAGLSDWLTVVVNELNGSRKIIHCVLKLEININR